MKPDNVWRPAKQDRSYDTSPKAGRRSWRRGLVNVLALVLRTDDRVRDLNHRIADMEADIQMLRELAGIPA